MIGAAFIGWPFALFPGMRAGGHVHMTSARRGGVLVRGLVKFQSAVA